MTEETKTPTPADLISAFKLRAKQYAEANGIDPKWTQEQQIAEALEASQARHRELEEALRLCQATFERYAQLHYAKKTADGDDKGMANQRMANICAGALNSPAGEQLEGCAAPSPTGGER